MLVLLHLAEVDLAIVVGAERDNLRLVGLRSEDGDVGGDLVDGRILPVLLLVGGMLLLAGTISLISFGSGEGVS